MYEKIKQFLSKAWGYIVAVIGGFIAALFFRRRDRGLDTNKQLLQSTEESIGESKQAVDRSISRIEGSERDLNELNQSINRNQDRVDKSIRTTEQLIETNNDIGNILDKYNQRIGKTKNN